MTKNIIDTFQDIESAAQSGAFGINPTPTPTDAQCLAGNYRVGRTSIYGLPVAIEQPRHSYRTGIDSKTGKRWTNRLAAHYGYFSGTKGNDGDPVDCFIGFYPQSEHAYVINQYINGQWDEHKVMLCFPDEETAKRAYLDSYDKGFNGLHSLVKASISQFKWWLKNGNMKKPLAPNHLPYDGYETMNKRIYWDSATALPEAMTLDQLLYQIRRADSGENLLLDSVSIGDILEEAEAILAFDALVTPYASLERKMTALKAVMERSGGTVKPVALQVTDPFKQNGVAQVAAVFELSDGQTVTIYFHNPDVDPRKIQQSNELISWKFLLNRKDITIVVAPERGDDINVREVARRVMKLAEKNSAAFKRANVNRAERMQAIEDLKTEITLLESELKDTLHELEVAKVEAEDRAEGAKFSIGERVYFKKTGPGSDVYAYGIIHSSSRIESDMQFGDETEYDIAYQINGDDGAIYNNIFESMVQKVESNQSPDEANAPDMAQMINQAALWKGATMQIAKMVEGNKKDQMALMHMTTKGDLDAYLMRKFGIDEATARDVSNALTSQDIPADMSANLEDYKDEPWYALIPASATMVPELPQGEGKNADTMTEDEFLSREDHLSAYAKWLKRFKKEHQFQKAIDVEDGNEYDPDKDPLESFTDTAFLVDQAVKKYGGIVQWGNFDATAYNGSVFDSVINPGGIVGQIADKDGNVVARIRIEENGVLTVFSGANGVDKVADPTAIVAEINSAIDTVFGGVENKLKEPNLGTEAAVSNIDPVLTAIAKSEEFGRQKKGFIGSTEGRLDDVLTRPGSDYPLWGFEVSSDGHITACFALGDGKYTSGDRVYTPEEAYASMTSRHAWKVLSGEESGLSSVITSPLDEFENSGGEPWQVTKEKWVEIMNGHMASLGQTGSDVDFAEFHKGAVKTELDAGKPVPADVLADYPGMKAETESEKAERYAQAEKDLNRLIGMAAGEDENDEPETTNEPVPVPGDSDLVDLPAVEEKEEQVPAKPVTELDKQRHKLKQLAELQERMKAANKVVNNKKLSDEQKVEQLIAQGFPDHQARELLKPDFAGRTGFASYQLTNNNAVIRNTQKRIADLEARELSESKATSGDRPTSYDFDGGTVDLAYSDDRIRINFDSKPDSDMIAKLKSNGFKWSPSNTAWQRQLTDNAIATTNYLLGTEIQTAASIMNQAQNEPRQNPIVPPPTNPTETNEVEKTMQPRIEKPEVSEAPDGQENVMQAAFAAELESLKLETSIEAFDKRLDEIADRIEQAGLMAEMDGQLNEAADKLTELMAEAEKMVA